MKKTFFIAILVSFMSMSLVGCITTSSTSKINKIEIYRGGSEEENRILYGNWEDMVYQIEENCFATKAEAQAKLKELGEKR